MQASQSIVFSIATNGYEQHFESCLLTQREFAARLGARYWIATGSPPWGISGHQSAWLKIPLCLRAMRLGYSQVCFLDSDCEVKQFVFPWAGPDSGADIRVALDFSQRINSGVIFLRNTREARRLLQKIWWSSCLPGFTLPKGDRNAYENGHIIRFWKNEPLVKIMDPRWNWATPEGESEAFIRHYGGWTARPKESKSGTGLQVWLRRLGEGMTAPLLLANNIYYGRRMPRPETVLGE